MRIIPAIDLRKGRCVRLTQGQRAKAKAYPANPVEVAREFEREGAQMLHVIDLDRAFAERRGISRRVVQDIIRAVKVPVQVGGGLRSAADIADLISAGAAEVVIGTIAANSPALLKRWVKLFGCRLVVAIAAKKGQVMIEGWEKKGDLLAADLARRVAGAGLKRIIYTDTARDGTLRGINFEQTCAIACESGLKITASGGLASLSELARLREGEALGIDSVIVGRALYDGVFTLEEAQRALSQEPLQL